MDSAGSVMYRSTGSRLKTKRKWKNTADVDSAGSDNSFTGYGFLKGVRDRYTIYYQNVVKWV